MGGPVYHNRDKLKRIVAVALAPGVFVKTNGSPEFSGATTTAPFKRPAKHSTFGDAVATGEFSARATSQEFLAHSGVETLGPFDLLVEGLTRFPGPMWAIWTLEAPHM